MSVSEAATAEKTSPRTFRAVAWVVITAGVAVVLGRLMAVDSVNMLHVYTERLKELEKAKAAQRQELIAQGLAGPELEKALQAWETSYRRDRLSVMRPFLSSNDRSRWCTVRALVEPDLWVYDEREVNGRKEKRWVPYAIDKVIQEPGWDTIDMIKHDAEGRGGLGPNEGHLYSSKPPLLPTLLAGPYWILYHLLGWKMAEHPYLVGRTLLVLVNVIPLGVYFWLLARLADRLAAFTWSKLFVLTAGVFGTFLTTFAVVLNNHLVGAVSAMIALAAAAPIWFDDDRRWRLFVLAGLFGAFAVANELPALAFFVLLFLGLLWKSPTRALLGALPPAVVVGAAMLGTNWIAHGTPIPPYARRHTTVKEENWYDYEYTVRRGDKVIVRESYWRNPQGIDRGEPSRAKYALHALIGHHGVFSLTPIWLLTVAGLIMGLVRPVQKGFQAWAASVLLVSVACLVFYIGIVKELNYGGQACGFRWAFWMAPLWLVGMIPAVDWLAQRRWGRCLALVLLAISVASAAYPTWNPWTHPWLYQWMDHMGWL